MKPSLRLRVSAWTGLALLAALGAILLWNAINARLDREIFFQERGEITRTPADLGLPYEELSLTTADGVRLHAWFIPGSGKAGLVLSPGYTDAMSRVLKYAPFLHEAGYALLLYDPRGQGQSEGELYAFGAFQVADIEAGMAELRRRGIEQIALFGHSNGANATLRAAAAHPGEVFAVIADSPFANLALAARSPESDGALLNALFPLFAAVARLRLGFDLVGRTDALKVVERVSHVLFIHGTADRRVTYQNAELLYARAGEPKALWLVEGAAHVKAFDADPDAYARRVLDFLAANRP